MPEGNPLKRTWHTALICALLAPNITQAQETTPSIELEEYRIIGRDTREFTIEGDRLSTVYYSPVEIILPEEKRSVKESEGLIGDEEREHRSPRFTMTTGPRAELDYTFGAFKTNDVRVLLGYAARTRGISLTLAHRSADAHTPTNLAPTAQTVNVMGYLKTLFGTVRGEVGFTRQDDDAVSKTFRPDSRKLSRFRMGGAIDRNLFGWDFSGHGRLESGTYTDILDAGDQSELLITGGGEATGRLLGTEVTLTGATDFYEFEDDNGSSLTAGISGSWLFGNRLGVTAGAAAATSAMPNDNTEFNLYPQAALDLALPAGVYARGSFKPRLVTRTFADLFAMNGLAVTAPDPDSSATVLLFEHRPIDLTGEIGFRHAGGLSLAVGGGYTKAEHAPVFSLFTTPGGDEFYELVRDAELTLRTMRFSGTYSPGGVWEVSGTLTANDPSWNFSGNVPYIPDMEGDVTASYILMREWTLRAAARYIGTHYTTRGSDDTEDAFLLIDIGVDRPLYRDMVSASLELRNLTDVDGGWWSGAYRAPGIGLYLGVHAEY